MKKLLRFFGALIGLSLVPLLVVVYAASIVYTIFHYILFDEQQ